MLAAPLRYRPGPAVSGTWSCRSITRGSSASAGSQPPSIMLMMICNWVESPSPCVVAPHGPIAVTLFKALLIQGVPPGSTPWAKWMVPPRSPAHGVLPEKRVQCPERGDDRHGRLPVPLARVRREGIDDRAWWQRHVDVAHRQRT